MKNLIKKIVFFVEYFKVQDRTFSALKESLQLSTFQHVNCLSNYYHHYKAWH